MRLAVIIPAYNEERVLAGVLGSFQREVASLPINTEPIVIDDGSTDKTATIARKLGVRVVSHHINLGLGGAISTGFLIAKREGHDALVTIDSDGQHSAKDLIRVMSELMNNSADFVVGSRWLRDSPGVPIHRRIGNKYIMNTLTKAFTGMNTSDSQSGLRGFSRRAIELIELNPQRMEISTEIFAQAKKHQLSYREIPIKAIYTDYSIQKGQRSVNGFSILWRLTVSRFIQ